MKIALLTLVLVGALAGAARADGAAEYVLIDGLAPFYDPAKPPIRNWAMPFGHMDLAAPPYVDEAHMERAIRRFGEYCDYVSQLGYNAVTIGNLIHLATFDGVPEGRGVVYSPESPFRVRAEKYKAYYRRAVEAAHARGMRVVVDTDFPAWTPPLREYLGPAGLAVANDRLFRAYRAAVGELFDEVGADALSVRIGEGGGAYDEAATGYSSTVSVRTVEDARKLVGELLGAVEDYNARRGAARRLLFRTWTIGLGEIGALHTSPELYEKVFSPFYGREALVTVVKHVAMDFFQYVPRNPTIGVGGLRQIVEVQARREFEGFCLFPNYRGESFSDDLNYFRTRAQFAGVSVWTTNGGFWLEAPIFYHANGPDEWIDLNAYAFAAMMRDPALAPARAAEEWAIGRGGLAREDGAAAAAILMRSADVVRRGLYVGGYARTTRALFGLEVIPTMMWLWWTRPVGAYGVQSMIFRSVRGDIAGSIAEGEGAVADVARMLDDAGRLAATPFRARLVESLRFEKSVLEMMAAYRRVFLNHHAWAIDGDGGAYAAWRAAIPDLERAMAEHEAAYRGARDLPALDLRELRRLVRDDRLIPGLRVSAGAVALADAAIALVLLLATRRLRWPGALATAAGAATLTGASAALFACGYRAAHVTASVALPLAAAWLTIALALTKRGQSPFRKSLPLFIPFLLLAAAGLGVFAVRGPVPVYFTLASALEAAWARWALGGAAAAFAAVSIAVGLRASGGRVIALAVGVAAALAVVYLLFLPKLTGLNEVLRLGPTMFGDAGTGVDELL